LIGALVFFREPQRLAVALERSGHFVNFFRIRTKPPPLLDRKHLKSWIDTKEPFIILGSNSRPGP
jgi:hypothetical protein